jgi:hypothetical protein
MSVDRCVSEAPPPVLSMLLPGCDQSALKALAGNGDILWYRGDEPEGSDQDRFEGFVEDVALVLEVGRRGRDFDMSRFWVRPDRAEFKVILGWLDLFRPLLTAHLSFQSMCELGGAAYARSVAVFFTPALTLFRSAVDTHADLARLRGWLDRYRWDAVLRGAHAQDLALWAVLSNAAAFEDFGSEKCIRLHEPLSP